MRKTYGNTWWGAQWLNAFNHIDYSNRLPRGRSYANRGFVLSISIDGNRISAKVQGSRRTPYRVDISIPVFSASEKARILAVITENPFFLSQLLNRTLPAELHDSLQQIGIDLFPRSWKDLTGGCSCPDWAVPCKHMAAVLYLVANEIDKNPFLVFTIHDFDLIKGLSAVGYSLEGGESVTIPAAETLWKGAKQLLDVAPPKQDSSAELKPIDFTKIPNIGEELLLLLPDHPVFYSAGNFKQLYAKGLSILAKAMSKSKLEVQEESTSLMDEVEHIEISLDTELGFLHCHFRNQRGKLLMQLDGIGELCLWLAEIPAGQLSRFSADLSFLYLCYRFSMKLAEQLAIVPQLLRVGVNYYKVRWLAATINESVNDLLEQLELRSTSALLYVVEGHHFHPIQQSERLQSLLSIFLGFWVDSYGGMRQKWDKNDGIYSLFFCGQIERFQSFSEQQHPIAIQLWLSNYFLSQKQYNPVLQVEDMDGVFKVGLAFEDRQRPLETPIPVAEFFEQTHLAAVRTSILSDLARLSEYFPQLKDVLATKGKKELMFDADEFVDILFKILPTIRLFGIKVLLPKALQKLLRPQLSMAIETAESNVVAKSGLVNMQDMLRFHWRIAVGTQQLTAEEFLEMINRYSGIVKLKDEYVYFDEREVLRLIHQLEQSEALAGPMLLQVALAEEYEGAKVTLSKDVQSLMSTFRKADPISLPVGLQASLRPYQQRGMDWLYKNTKLGFGSILADDMGLGKTLQIITLILKLKEEGELTKNKALVVVPTTLLTNWQKEVQKFAPALVVSVYHGPNRNLAQLAKTDILLSTYGVVRSDNAQLIKKKWAIIVIDEAQNIKNSGTAQTKAIKKIKAKVKVAMSGTPVENRLTEYWSIFDFTNKSYLGTLAKFKDNFARPIELDRDQEKLQQFKRLTEPFILRRVKTDKQIIQDLPEKIEQDQFCELRAEQAALYQNVVDRTMKQIEEVEGINRRGLVLKLITALKQICNHPKQFLKKGDTDPMLSGKTILLFQLLRSIFDNDQKVLIFTQYQEMGKLLVSMIEKEFGVEAPFLHGGVTRKGRDEMVEDFQHNRNTRLLLLSLKAGGTGLNLTAASNIIHYDLWWNPAVEAQATDRAYRIGQERNVMVHRFITKGTFEEKINQLLINKKELADLTVATGEKWIGEYSNNELKELLTLD